MRPAGSLSTSSLSGEAAVVEAAAENTVFSKHLDILNPPGLFSKYHDSEWDLTPIAVRPGANPPKINFTAVPIEFYAAAKRLVWVWINIPTPVERLKRKSAARSRLAAQTIMNAFDEGFVPLSQWLVGDGITRLQDVTPEDLNRYATRFVLRKDLGRDSQARVLFFITRIWLHAPYLPEADRLVIPPWEQGSLNDLLGPPASTAENKTPPIHPQTMSPLLVWALRFVEDFSEDILDAVDKRDQLRAKVRTHTKSGDLDKLRAYVHDLQAAGKPIPGFISKRQGLQLAREYIAGLLEVGMNAFASCETSTWQLSDHAPLGTRVTGRIDEKPWIQALDYYQVDELRSKLATACLIVTAYLSGMRAQEVIELRRGCCQPSTASEGGPPRYSITARVFKSAIDAEGNSIPGGMVREQPWHVIAPVAKALSVAERLSNNDVIFCKEIFATQRVSQAHLAAPTINLRAALKDFVSWTNEHAIRIGLVHEAIPDDPDGPLHLGRFRRTLAWFIYRQPGGRVAVGIQYGHLLGQTSEGYASRSTSGLRGVFPMEEAVATAERLSEAAERLARGEHVSGPAAKRYIDGISEFAGTFPGKWLTPHQMAALRKNPRLRIFDNGIHPVACCYDASKALCHPQRKERKQDATTTPDLTRCNTNCGNVARTDTHIQHMRDEIVQIEREIAAKITPIPMKERLKQRAEFLQAIVERHETAKVAL